MGVIDEEEGFGLAADCREFMKRSLIAVHAKDPVGGQEFFVGVGFQEDSLGMGKIEVAKSF